MLSADGSVLTERAKVETPYPCPPETFLATIRSLVATLDVDYHRVSMGFPGLVRHGHVYNIPSLSRREYGGPSDPELAAAWGGFDLGGALTGVFSVPVKVANDADVQGCAVAQGRGVRVRHHARDRRRDGTVLAGDPADPPRARARAVPQG